jgi:S-adenosylmethionine-diacylglycerol 3-amino-3-carboxypropyl transferase
MSGSSPSWIVEATALPIAFAQVREDPLLDRQVVDLIPGPARVLMVASGGCTAALLAASGNISHIHLVDPNPAQIALARLKLFLLQRIDKSARLALLGHTPMAAKERQRHVAELLGTHGYPPEILGPVAMWAELGPDHAGRYERLFVQLRRRLESHASELASLLALSDPVEQARRVHAQTELGRVLNCAFYDVMALPNLVGLFGEEATRNPVEPFARHFARRTRHVLATLPAADNPYLWQLLAGRYPDSTPVPWLKENPPAFPPEITWTVAKMDDALAAAPGPFDFVHLSNILDWLSPQAAKTTLERACTALAPGGYLLIRQLNSSLDIPSLGGRFIWLTEKAAAWHARDRSFFYRALHLGRKE